MSIRRSGRARCPSTAKRAPSAGPPASAASSASRSSRRRATSRASGPGGGDGAGRVERGAQPGRPRRPGRRRAHPTSAPTGRPASARLERLRGGGRVVEREQGGRQAGGGAAVVAQRGRRREQRHLAPAALGVAGRGGPGGDDEGIGHRETVADGRTRVPLYPRGDEPARGRDQPVPAPARRQPGGLVPVGRRGLRPRPRRGPADAPVGRLLVVPLVPRDGARVVRGPGHRRGHERAVREREGRPRGAPRRRRHLHAGHAGADRVRAAGR